MIRIQQAENALKQVYLDVISNQLNCNIDGFLSKIEKTTTDVWGKEILVPVCRPAYSFVEEDMYLLAKDELVNIYGHIQISDKAVRAAETSVGAFVDLLNNEVENMLKETKEHIVNATYGKDKAPIGIPETIKKFTPLKLSGLKEVFDTEKKTLYRIDRKKYNFNPVVKTIKEINTFEIEQVIDETNNEINFLICSPNTKRKIKEFMSSHYQNVEQKLLPDGLYYMELNENVVIQTYKYMPDNEIWLVNSNDFKFHQLCDWRWIEDEEGHILRMQKNKPIYNATLVKYGNLMCHNPSRQIKIIVGE